MGRGSDFLRADEYKYTDVFGYKVGECLYASVREEEWKLWHGTMAELIYYCMCHFMDSKDFLVLVLCANS